MDGYTVLLNDKATFLGDLIFNFVPVVQYLTLFILWGKIQEAAGEIFMFAYK